jgi:hypothetical protein
LDDDIHPYTTVQPTANARYVAVLIDKTPEGIVQVSDKGEEHEDFIAAKREAVEMALRADIRYLVPVYG